MQLMELRISAVDFHSLQERLFRNAPNECAAFLAIEAAGDRIVARSMQVFDSQAFERPPQGELSLTEAAQLDALARLKRQGHGAVEVHTHPGSGANVTFSRFDLQQLPDFARYVRNKLPGRPYAALVLGERGYEGIAVSDRQENLVLQVAGERSAIPSWLDSARMPETSRSSTDEQRFDRQIRALGPEGQRQLRALRVGVIGVGGTGSQVAQQLAHLGCSGVMLSDGDRIEGTNLHRLAGSAWWDPVLRRKKTSNARRFFTRVNPHSHVIVTGGLRTSEALEGLKQMDLIIGCVDNDGARLILSELAAAYLIPYLDVAVGVERGDETRIGGRVAFYLPGGPCLACADDLDFEEAAEDLENESLHRIRLERGYARDRRVEAALMPLNTVLAGIALIEVLAFATGIRRVRPFTRYDALTNQIVTQHVAVNLECPVCRPAYGMGDRQSVDRYALADRSLTRSRRSAISSVHADDAPPSENRRRNRL
jgi:molybdopterin/thiamine biosynthesis adenylyltransferase